MPLLYATILQGSTVLCKYADGDGKFAEMTENLITKIHLRGDHKMTDLVDGDYLLHYICADNKIYLCISDSEFSRDCALKYLGKIKTEFFNLYYLATEEAETALPYESLEKTFPLVMATEMKRCNVNELKNGINKMVIEKVEQINSLAERSKTLQNNVSSLLQMMKFQFYCYNYF